MRTTQPQMFSNNMTYLSGMSINVKFSPVMLFKKKAIIISVHFSTTGSMIIVPLPFSFSHSDSCSCYIGGQQNTISNTSSFNRP